MKIKNYELQSIGEFLYGLKLTGMENIMRARFIRTLEDQLELLSQERQFLVNDYAKKDSDGNHIIEIVNEQETILLSDVKEYKKQLTLLMNDDFIIEKNDKTEKMFVTLRKIVLDLMEAEFSEEDAMIYARLYDLLEDC